ncbi:hypothetical protein JYU34_011211, partial [Plutella xylostella]
PATSPLHTGGNCRSGELLLAARVPAAAASEDPVPHQITCNQFRDLHACVGTPGLTSRR